MGYEPDASWAKGAAKQDASFLISPTARTRALDLLRWDTSDEATAARVILHDGGAQQGGEYRGEAYVGVSLETWRPAADLLGAFE